MATKAHLEGNKRYLEHLDETKVRTKKGTKDRWKAAAEERGKSLNQFIIDSVEKEIAGESLAGGFLK